MNKSLKIGFDLDDTLVYHSIITKAAKKLGYDDYSDKTFRDWKSTNFPSDLRSLIHEMYNSVEYMCKNTKLIANSQKLIKELSKAGHKIFLITARNKTLKEETIKLVNKYFPEIKDIYFVDIDQTKISYMKKLKLEYWVDDAPHECLNAIGLAIKTILISNEKTKYNWNMRDNKQLYKVVRGVYNLNKKDFK